MPTAGPAGILSLPDVVEFSPADADARAAEPDAIADRLELSTLDADESGPPDINADCEEALMVIVRFALVTVLITLETVTVEIAALADSLAGPMFVENVAGTVVVMVTF